MKFEEMKDKIIIKNNTKYIPEYSIMIVESEDYCHICGKSTKSIDFCYEARMCSTECQTKMDKILQKFEEHCLELEEEI